MRWRTLLIDGPALVVDLALALYGVLLAGIAIACYVSVALVILAYLLGFPVR